VAFGFGNSFEHGVEFMAKKKSKAKKAVGKKGKKSAPKKAKKKMAKPAKKRAVRKPPARKRAPRPEPVTHPEAGPAVIAAEELTIVVETPADLGQLNEPGGPDMTSAT
jgi:hypothetical protein